MGEILKNMMRQVWLFLFIEGNIYITYFAGREKSYKMQLEKG